MSTKNNPSVSSKGNNKPHKQQPQPKKAPIKVPEVNYDKWIWVTLGIILLITFILYFKAIKFDFLYTWDDNVYIKENSSIKDLGWANIKQFFTGFYSGNYQPVTILIYAIEYKLSGYSASLYHFNNILLHIANTYLVFVLIRKISPKSIITALITTAFFAVHPVHVESVAWVAERKDVLYSFFFLLSLIVYTNYLRSSKLILLLLSGILFVLSCLSKSAAVILPLVLLLLDYYSDRKYSWKMFLEKAPFFAISLIFGLVAMKSQNAAIQDAISKISPLDRSSIVSYSFLSYIFKAFIPANLSAVYPYPRELGSMLPLKYYFSILTLIALLLLVWYSRKWNKDVIFGFLFFVITIILVLQFVPVGGAAMADRYTYIPYIGLFFAAGKLLEYFSESVHFKKILAAVVLTFIIFSTVCNNRIKIWRNDETLFTDVINKYPYCTIAHFDRGLYCLHYNAQILYANNSDKKTRNIVSAIKDFDETLKLDEKYPDVYLNRGYARYMIADYAGSKLDFDRAIELKPDAITYYNRGNTKKELNDFAGAIQDFDKTIQLSPSYVNAYNNRSILKCMLKDYEGTIADYDKMIELNPNDTTTIKNRNIIRAILENSKK
jgi:protein O-mannosyl-transferase